MAKVAPIYDKDGFKVTPIVQVVNASDLIHDTLKLNPDEVKAINSAFDSGLTQIFADADGNLKAVVRGFIIERPMTDELILVDSCIGGEKILQALPQFHGNVPDITDRIREEGFDPDKIKIVAHSHFHEDHASAQSIILPDGRIIARFDNATHIYVQEEYDEWLARYTAWQSHLNFGPGTDFVQFATAIQPLVDMGKVKFVDLKEQEIVPGVTILPLVGHTKGHVGILINNEIVLIGDAAHSLLQVLRPDIGAQGDSDPATAVITRHEIFAKAAANNWIVVPSHGGEVRIFDNAGTFTFTPV